MGCEVDQIQPGDIVQVDPECPNPRLAGVLLTVHGIEEHRILCFSTEADPTGDDAATEYWFNISRERLIWTGGRAQWDVIEAREYQRRVLIQRMDAQALARSLPGAAF